MVDLLQLPGSCQQQTCSAHPEWMICSDEIEDTVRMINQQDLQRQHLVRTDENPSIKFSHPAPFDNTCV